MVCLILLTLSHRRYLPDTPRTPLSDQHRFESSRRSSLTRLSRYADDRLVHHARAFSWTSRQLRNVWDGKITKHGEPARLNVIKTLSKMTLDVIGLAGFNYRFDGLSGKPNELAEAFNQIFDPSPSITFMMVARNFLPILNVIVSGLVATLALCLAEHTMAA